MSKLGAAMSVIKFLSFFFDRKAIDSAKAKVAIDAGERYMMVNEGNSPYKNITVEKKNRLLKHYRKRFIAYN